MTKEETINEEKTTEGASSASQTKKEKDIVWHRESSAGGEGEDFRNTGLEKWEATRAHWLSNKSDTDSTSRAAVPLEVDGIIDVIFAPRWRNPGQETGPPRRFAQNVPLPQMVDVLVDLWEAEGLDM